MSRASGRLVRSSCLGKLGGNDFALFWKGIEQAFDYLEQRQIGALLLPIGCASPSAITGVDSLEQRFLALDVGLGPIATWRRFVVPTTTFVFVRNIRCVSRNDLLVRCAIRRLASQVMRRKGFGKHPVDAIGPTTVVLNNCAFHGC